MINARVLRFARRTLNAAKIGVFYTGSSRFPLPDFFRLNGRKYWIDAPREQTLAWVFSDLVLDDEYGLLGLKTEPRTILDIGANVGLFTLWAGANFPSSRIHAYEPNPRIQKYLVASASQVDATVFDEGVGPEDGLGSFSEYDASITGMCSESGSGDIKLVSLRTALERIGGHVDLLKLDCEGAEWDLFDDLRPFENVDFLRLEYHFNSPKADLELMIERLKSAGLSLVKLKRNQGFGVAWFDRDYLSTK